MIVSILALALLATAPPQSASLVPRNPLPKQSPKAIPLPAGAPAPLGPSYRLTVKFEDAEWARPDAGGSLVSLAGRSLADANKLLASLGAAARPLIRLPESSFQELARRAEARTGRRSADLGGMLVIELPDTSPASLEAAGAAFEKLASVEYAYIETLGCPPPGDVPPTTPDLVALQGYRGPDPGMNVNFLWSQGLKGAGVRISDCEYAWNASHEDLVDINLHPEPGQTPSNNALVFIDHGTAVAGELASVVNPYGCSGMTPDASIYTFPELTNEGGARRVECITNAILGSKPGDVVLLEMQTVGAGGNFGPAELDPNVWLVVKNGTSAGVVVVGAAGNGNQNLDSAAYAPYMALGDSGAILVGAGSASSAHDKLSFSTFGSRVNVQGWGELVFTLGYGDFATYGGDKNQRYTAVFSGTSSASPFIASASAALQQRARQLLGAVLAPETLRALLVNSGVPQGAGGHIGPFPNLQAAYQAVPNIPVITQQPASANVCAGMPVAFSIAASGSPTFQWHKNGAVIPGATAATHSIPVVTAADGGIYQVAVTQGNATVISDFATLSTSPGAVAVGGPATPGCAGVQKMGITSCAKLGNASFAVTCDNAPSNSLGILLLGNALNPVGSDYFGINVLLSVDPFASTWLEARDMPTNAHGIGTTPLPIPNNPSIVGTYYLQPVFYWGSSCAVPFSFSASRAVSLAVTP